MTPDGFWTAGFQPADTARETAPSEGIGPFTVERDAAGNRIG